MNGFWGQVMEGAVNVLKNEKGAIYLLVGILFIAGYAYAWANDNFVQKGDFNELKEQVDEGFEDSELRDASQTIQLLRIEKLLVQATGATEKEIKDINDEYENAKKYKECLRTKGPNCEHLKEAE